MKYESLKIDVRSFAASTLSFTLPVKDIKDPLPYDYGDAFIYAPALLVEGLSLFLKEILAPLIGYVVFSCTSLGLSGSSYK